MLSKVVLPAAAGLKLTILEHPTHGRSIQLRWVGLKRVEEPQTYGFGDPMHVRPSLLRSVILRSMRGSFGRGGLGMRSPVVPAGVGADRRPRRFLSELLGRREIHKLEDRVHFGFACSSEI